MAASSNNARPPVVVVTGPTAGGKTDLAIRLARRFQGEIVNADSTQVYRHMDVGTAKPTAEQRALATHHLLDVVDPDETYDAGRYGAEARAVAARIQARGSLAILAGGSGLYLRAFLEGLLEGHGRDAALRERLEAEQREAAGEGDPARLHRRLVELDPATAARIHPRDLRRTVRALELLELTGRTASELRREHAFADRPFRVLYLVVDPGREELDARIDTRCARMIEGGLLQEVRRLRERGYGPELPALQAIGYRHMQPVIEGSETLANVLAAMRRDTRHLARRQRTWFRAVPEAVWVRPDEGAEIAKRVEEFLAG
jgi:tRNA dimethylallyltransferase